MRVITKLLFSLLCIGVSPSVPAKVSDGTEEPREAYITLTLDWASHFGTWGELAFCPEGSFAHAFRLKVESESAHDDTALNAIELSCAHRRQLGTKDIQERDSTITSSQGHWGDWKALKTCSDGFLTGLRMKSEEPQGHLHDDTAANDLEMQCAWGSEIHNGEGDHWGRWSSWSYCPQGWAICGLQTRVEGTSANDDTALNDVKMFCCYLPQGQ
ncbi:unnamed protein product [Meganyctiphanes norvegica]|uniref:Vitelline membrane outer layer protein 1 homolog n=1 Tax=Meganyctiphanes norvegica TaxID=48144 RepID=A0AAV2R3M1_MEGNR